MRVVLFFAYLVGILATVGSPLIMTILVVRMLGIVNKKSWDAGCAVLGCCGLWLVDYIFRYPSDVHEFVLIACNHWWLFWPVWGLIVGFAGGVLLSFNDSFGIGVERGRNGDRALLLSLFALAFLCLCKGFAWSIPITLSIAAIVSISVFAFLYLFLWMFMDIRSSVKEVVKTLSRH